MLPTTQRVTLPALLFLIGLALCGSLTSCSELTSGQFNFEYSNKPPEVQDALALYDEVWRTVEDDYVDATNNGQDWLYWRHRYDDQIQNKDDAYMAINTMLASLNDPYTRILNPRDVEEQTMKMDAKLFGIGVQINFHKNEVVVVSPLDESPAMRAGLMPMDIIKAVDGKSLKDVTIDQVADLIRGPKGTRVVLTIDRDGQTFDVPIIRDEITLKTVFQEDLQDNIGYIRLSTFISQDASDEMEQALRKYKDKKAIILDLRGNNGGLLRNALRISDMFLKQGEIVSVIGRNGEREVYRSSKETLFDKPLVVLINQGSASASEIVSGALQDNHRATLIGETSFGKGMVQKINPLHDGSDLYMTVSKYYTPDGKDINQKGIAPNVEIELTMDDFEHDRDPQKAEAIALIRRELLSQTQQAALDSNTAPLKTAQKTN